MFAAKTQGTPLVAAELAVMTIITRVFLLFIFAHACMVYQLSQNVGQDFNLAPGTGKQEVNNLSKIVTVHHGRRKEKHTHARLFLVATAFVIEQWRGMNPRATGFLYSNN